MEPVSEMYIESTDGAEGWYADDVFGVVAYDFDFL